MYFLSDKIFGSSDYNLAGVAEETARASVSIPQKVGVIPACFGLKSCFRSLQNLINPYTRNNKFKALL